MTGTLKPFFPQDGEGARRRVKIRPFALEETAVSTQRFASFVAATGYVSTAESLGESFVFQSHLGSIDPSARLPQTPWWVRVPGAHWAAPFGPGSDWRDEPESPVRHVSFFDARVFSQWCGGRLPTEAEWEFAASGGRSDRLYPWGGGEAGVEMLNVWQGRFPDEPQNPPRTLPVRQGLPQNKRLWHMVGNVWQWTADAFRTRSLSRLTKERDHAAQAERQRVLKGGSYLCHPSYCWRYRIAARSGASPDSTTSHIGFRVAYEGA
ncbi:hypothetical protein BWR17_19295 (plasmid) [Phaeobacter inhibens]|nr:hypothetical protein BWR17_19295 [Phaeobacter inhibens]